MKKRVGIVSLTLLLLASASAGVSAAEPPAQAPTPEVHTGTGVICDTAEEVTRFVGLIGEHDPLRAIAAVNDEVANPIACGVATVAFEPGKAIGDVHNTKGTYKIMEISVIAAQANGNWRMVAPRRTQYVAVPLQGFDI